MKRNALIFSLMMGVALWRIRKPTPTDLRGKVVVITGASAGIGKAAAHAFALEEAKLVLAARRAEVLQAVKAELQRYQTPILTIPADVSEEADLQKIITETLREFGQIDVLINNAGLTMGGDFTQNDGAEVEKLLRVNLFGVVRLTQLALPSMLARRSGHIVNVSSIASEARMPGTTAYVAAKAGVNGFTETLRRELAGTGVEVSDILPGWTQTAMIASLKSEELTPGLMGKLITVDTPEQVANAMVDLVRYKRRRKVMGGAALFLALLVSRWSPQLADFLFKSGLMDKNFYVNATRNLGSDK